jgi:hypothetical protein
MKPVKLQAVVDEMDILDDEMTAYINKKTGELYAVTDEDQQYVEDGYDDNDFIPDWQREILPKVREVLESEDFVPLPDNHEINDYSIMERYCYGIDDAALQEKLLHAISGKGAFSRFKDLIYQKDLQDDWYRYRNQALKDIAVDFLREEGIAFEDG